MSSGSLRRAFNDIMADDWPYGSRTEDFYKECDWCGTQIPHFVGPLVLGDTDLIAYLCRQCARAQAATTEGVRLP